MIRRGQVSNRCGSRALRLECRKYRLTFDPGSMEEPSVPAAIAAGHSVQCAPVVPEDEVANFPLVTIHEAALRRVGYKRFHQAVAYGLRHPANS